MNPRTPDQLQADELFRAELRLALETPAIQSALQSLRFHRGLLRTAKAASPANIIHHAAVWTGGFNAALDDLESMTQMPKASMKLSMPYDYIQPQEDQP